ncbi:MAG: histidine kinase [Bacteroidales bacterium]|nr:histidine kinase [Bacteroidales bacterium]
MLASALLATLLTGLGFSSGTSFSEEFPILFATALLSQITVFCIVYMVNYAFSAKREMEEERERANKAQYRYIKLKHQVNPHFLFNSLNILDCLICEESTERASAYTHKLAGVYRYMLKSEEEVIVPLRDELVFVNMYVDLLKERFPVGFVVKTDVPEDLMARFVLPCSIQLLIENAIKHNVVSEENPLIISIMARGEEIVVTNNVAPKVTKTASTGLGQKYIRQMYLDITGRQIGIEQTDTNYQVHLPLI